MRHIKSVILLVIVCAVLAISLFCAWREQQSLDDGIRIHVIDVGQGDCMVIETSQGNVMIDAGTDISELSLRGYLRSHGLTQFAYLILSHPHDDHIGSADMILREFGVDRVICADSQSTEAVWKNFLIAMDEARLAGKTEWIQPIPGTVCRMGEVRIEVLMSPEPQNEGSNNDSLIVRLDYGDCSMLLTGDAEAIAEERLLQTAPHEKLSVDFLKVAHHGSSGSSGEEFLQAVNPRIAVISAGSGNSFSHPHEEVLVRLRKVNAEIYRTDLYGSLIFFCDGVDFYLKKPLA